MVVEGEGGRVMNINPEKDPSVSTEEGRFWDWITREIRQHAVDSLLRGSDVQCFTTQQYAERYSEQNRPAHRNNPLTRVITYACARMHLETLGTVREVKPDVWASSGSGNEVGIRE
jgi:hypothetical protein